MNEPAEILCLDQATAPLPPEDAVAATCHRCGAAVWLSPAGVNLMLRRGVQPICLGCVPEGAVAVWQPGQRDELMAVGLTEDEVNFLEELLGMSDGEDVP